ncbi:sugar ABC transporter substrate-binding protein [Microbacterium hominis]|uniref:ABC transporter substrate-binding protein n=1 Tax=Microbacterium TaxID=33882 RepID=UPI00076885BC|nr:MULTISPECIES: sugar ABC transporter substrate-binding protein [Microbacterium]KXC06612.1 sugar ABC transporter substrate-binding protein [Microbacterium hominis]QOC27268.1 sugar ABC transporter substrate-binding protein [Microbacterium hominis]QOC28411.1 sugar ABC transporter substrate-binding protein [Microbacterium hominis]QRY40058.1 sugar ABC transporter substrate-binding protein [Microbacterium hominis]QYF96395.1 sugar ABC transporter substrate-binding protein [Microbacterium sp. PAMC21
MTSTKKIARVVAIGATALLIGSGLAACAGGNSSSSTDAGSASSIDEALKAGGELTYWTWTPSAKDQVAAFEKAYPNVKVNLVNTGGANDNNTKLQNAISAGSGIPDVVQIEYQSLPQFQLSGSLLDLTAYGFGDLEKDYTASTWGAVSQNGGIWGLPQDSGPMALFYNKEVFDQFGISVPKTWDEFVAAGEKLHAADPTKYITNDQGTDAGFGTSMIWQAGGRPFKTDGENVTIDLGDAGAKKWTAVWDKLLQNGSLGNIPGWSDEWFQALGDGTIASLPIGAWMPGVLEANVPGGKGKWAVAPMPTYDGTPVTAENGGSSEVVMKGSKNQALAAGFLKWLNNSQDSIDVFLQSGGFPATTADLESSAFLNTTSDYFGGQKINEVLVDAAKSVGTGWQYLPWQSYANSIYADTVGKAYLNKTSIADGLTAWQDKNVSYGTDQGFSVNK